MDHNKRKDYNTRTQYDVLEKCLYDCKGNNSCDLYRDYNNSCLWYEVIMNDISKFKSNKRLSFPILEKILNNNDMKISNKNLLTNDGILFVKKIKEYRKTSMYKNIKALEKNKIYNSLIVAEKVAQNYAMQFVRERVENRDTIIYVSQL